VEKPTDLAEAFSTVLELARPLAAQHNVRLETDPDDSLPQLAVHPVALNQILLNLLDVAIHHTPGGQVTLSARSLRRDVEIEVQCTKTSAAPQPISGDDTASLDMARQLVDLCEGQLVLITDAEAFSGTLTLPVVEQRVVLVIDDQADALQLLQRYTSGTRYCLVGTQDPEQALSLAGKFSPQVIVLDVMMPEVDGWSILAKLRHHPLTNHIPIVVCTILPQEELAYSLGANAFIRKPIARQKFLATLDQHIRLMESKPR
jgi:CheY-like chemotaxis protein